jgi:hypothetical protein
METEYYQLGQSESSSFIKFIRVLFGLVCMGIAIYWMIFNITSAKTDLRLWITVLFLSGFGFYQVWAGTGRAARFIQISDDRITLKKNALLGAKQINASEIIKIEVYPLNLIFYFKDGKKIILRFGTTFTDIIDPVKNKTEEFASINSIALEIITEEF